jgi:hypothetical protein
MLLANKIKWQPETLLYSSAECDGTMSGWDLPGIHGPISTGFSTEWWKKLAFRRHRTLR